MKSALRQVGNSRGVIIPKSLITQYGFDEGVEMRATAEGLMLVKPQATVRAGWAEASKNLALSGDDALAWPEFANEGDGELVW
ncbi:hypothetical protein ACFQNF_06625 [Iodobacter arcticus]|uniref:SpoVT-AbrB domain-containing protein n=1 Tax=Iodobacter arcticus TaxID=590593 RepID=A0ABW2QUZ8_9NEIS